MFSDFLMKSKKTKTQKSKKITKKTPKKKSKKSLDSTDDSGIVLIDDDLEVDSEKELEERKAYLEEARSQDSSDKTKSLFVLSSDTKYESVMFGYN